MSDERVSRSWRTQVPLYLSLAVIAALAFVVCRYFLLTFTMAAASALMLAGLHVRLTERLGGRRSLAAAIIVMVGVLAVLLPLAAYGTLLTRQAVHLAEWAEPRLEPQALDKLWTETLPRQYPRATKWARRFLGDTGPGHPDTLARLAGYFDRAVPLVLLEGSSLAIDVVIFLMLVFFLLRDAEEVREMVRGISPFTRGQETEVLAHLSRTVKGVFLTLILVPVAQGLLALLGFWVFGVPAAVLLSGLVVLTALLPMLGTPLVWVPAGLYLVFTHSPGRGLALLAYGAVVIAMVDNVLKPIILKETARVHTMLGFLFILGGVYAFGAKGLVGGPVILSLVISAYRIYRYDVLRWRDEGMDSYAGR